jgi:hypothetical protein
MALPNKLYDGPYFGVPIVVAEATLLAERAREWGIGIVVDPRLRGFADRLLDRLTPEYVGVLSETALGLGVGCFVEDYERVVPALIRISN